MILKVDGIKTELMELRKSSFRALISQPCPSAKEISAKDIGEKDADEATKSVKAAKKTRTKKAKEPAKEETGGSSSAPKVEPGVVVSDPQENVDKVEKKSSKKSKKKPSSNVVEEA